MELENATAQTTDSDANSRSELDLDDLWQRKAQAFLSFLPNTPLRDSLARRLEEVYAAKHNLQSPLLKTQIRSCIKTQVQECGAIMEGLLNNRLDQDFKKEILARYGRKDKRRVKDISMNNKADFAVQKGIITKKLKKRICKVYRLRNYCHVDKEIRKNYVPSTSDAQEAFETLEQFVLQLKEH